MSKACVLGQLLTPKMMTEAICKVESSPLPNMVVLLRFCSKVSVEGDARELLI
jgi:hypothetical protein